MPLRPSSRLEEVLVRPQPPSPFAEPRFETSLPQSKITAISRIRRREPTAPVPSAADLWDFRRSCFRDDGGCGVPRGDRSGRRGSSSSPRTNRAEGRPRRPSGSAGPSLAATASSRPKTASPRLLPIRNPRAVSPRRRSCASSPVLHWRSGRSSARDGAAVPGCAGGAEPGNPGLWAKQGNRMVRASSDPKSTWNSQESRTQGSEDSGHHSQKRPRPSIGLLRRSSLIRLARRQPG